MRLVINFHATNPHQPVLFEEDPSKDLAEKLACRFSKKKLKVSMIKTYVEDETPFRAPHMTKALRSLEEEGKIFVEPCEKSRRKKFTDDVIVSF